LPGLITFNVIHLKQAVLISGKFLYFWRIIFKRGILNTSSDKNYMR
jgi:hypothetical protein